MEGRSWALDDEEGVSPEILFFPGMVLFGSLGHPKSRSRTVPLSVRCGFPLFDLERTELCSSTLIILCAPWLGCAGPWALSWDLTVITNGSWVNSEICWVLLRKSTQALL